MNVIEKNYVCRIGTADLIYTEGDTLVFRGTDKNLRRVASSYLCQDNRLNRLYMDFDIRIETVSDECEYCDLVNECDHDTEQCWSKEVRT